MDRSDPHYFEKHCSSTSTRVSRDSRAEGAVGWLPLAVAARGGECTVCKVGGKKKQK